MLKIRMDRKSYNFNSNRIYISLQLKRKSKGPLKLKQKTYGSLKT